MKEATSATICEDVSGLLPWLPGSGLEAGERRRVLEHLHACPRCREELLYLSELRAAAEILAPASGEAEARVGLARVLERIESHEVENHESGVGAAGKRPKEERRPRARWERTWQTLVGGSGWRPIAAVAGLVLALAIAVPWSEAPAPEPPPRGQSEEASGTEPRLFETLSTGDGEPGRTGAVVGDRRPRVKVGFRPEVRVAELQQLLTGLGGEVIAGPSRLGIFTVAFPENADPRSLARALRDREDVSFAEAVALPPVEPSEEPAARAPRLSGEPP